MPDKTIYSLRVKCAPMQTPEGDKRYWYADHYGFSDDFGTPIIDDTNGPYGPPPYHVEGNSPTTRYAGSLIGTLARVQGYDSGNNQWVRLAVNSDGSLPVTLDGFVSVLAPAIAMQSGVVAVGTGETVLLAADLNRRYVRFEVPAGAADVWISPAGAGTSAVGRGIRLSPGLPYTLDQFRFNTAWMAISSLGSVNVAYVSGSV